jgi:predicted SnoaL-like aldol condensation-catalyzing enzyme
MDKTSLKDQAVSFLQYIVAGRVEVPFEKYIAPNFKHHNPYFHSDAESLKLAMEEDAIASPNKVFKVKHAIEEGDLVTIHSHIKQNPVDLGAAVFHLFRFQENKIVELWDLSQPVLEDAQNEIGLF